MARPRKGTTTAAGQNRHRTTPLPGTLTPVPGYPKKLAVYRLEASCYWWVRYYANKQILRRSTKTDNKAEAFKVAKAFYDEINRKTADKESLGRQSRFDVCAQSMLKTMDAEVARRELTKDTYDIVSYRLQKSILPFFGKMDITDIHYEHLEQYLNDLSHLAGAEKISLSTIDGYMKIVRKVFTYAYKRRHLHSMPIFPAVSVPDNARGYFTVAEYRRMRNQIRAMMGKRYAYRVTTDDEGNKLGRYYDPTEPQSGKYIRSVLITRELYELVVFMVNGYIRPTDIKNMRHKHVETIRSEHTYLRLNLPASKKHDKPITTMAQAVTVYERLTQHNKDTGRGVGPDDFVFYPDYPNREHALKLLQRQFDVLMSRLDMAQGPNGESRTIYSLRHTCIMYRLRYGDYIDPLTLARNARTSPDMIDRFYASQLKGEDNIALLQSRRRRSKTPVPD
jgi:hypothetical protein